MGTQLAIEDILLYPNSTCTLLSYKNIRHKGFHVETHNDDNNEYQFIIKSRIYQANAWKNSFNINGIVYHIHQTRRNVAYMIIFRILIYSRHGIIALIILGDGWHKNYRQFNWSPHKYFKFSQIFRFVCTTYTMGKLILRTSYLKIKAKLLQFLEHIQWEIYGWFIH